MVSCLEASNHLSRKRSCPISIHNVHTAYLRMFGKIHVYKSWLDNNDGSSSYRSKKKMLLNVKYYT